MRKTLQPDPKTYAVLTAELERWRLELAKRHKMAKTDAERAAVERDARVLLERVLPSMMCCWLHWVIPRTIGPHCCRWRRA